MTIASNYTCDAESKLTYLSDGDEIVCMNCYQSVMDERNIAEEGWGDLQGQVESLNNTLEETQMELADAHSEITSLRYQVEELEQRLTDANAEVAELERRLENG